MRKVSLILTVLLFTVTVPTWATVTITCQPGAGTSLNDVLVSYTNTEPNKVRAFALDIKVTNGTITAVDDNINDWYKIYPGTIVIEGNSVVKDGNAVAVRTRFEVGSSQYNNTGPGLDSNWVTVEMGALYSPPNDAHGPNNVDPLLKFHVTPVNPNANSVITIVQNSIRGGVVLTDPNKVSGTHFTVVSAGCTIVRQPPDCLKSTDPGYAAWISALWNKPDCWCYCRQCRGDVDGKKTGTKWVALSDLTIIYAAYDKTDPVLVTVPNGICADLDHKKTGTKRVALSDLTIAYTYYDKVVGSVPRCDQAPIITGPYDHWVIPAGSTCP